MADHRVHVADQMSRCAASTYTYLWRSDLDRAFDDIASAGFEEVELLAAPPHVEVSASLRGADGAAQAAMRAGLRIRSVAPSGLDVNLASPDPSMRDWTVEYFTNVGRFAAAVGAQWLIAHPGRRHPLRPPPYEDCLRWATDGMARVVDGMQAVGLGVLVENTPTGILDSGRECADLVRAVGDDALGVCYDVANGHMVEPVGEGIEAVAPFLRLVHLSDATRASWAHDPIGQGEIHFGDVGATLGKVGYGGGYVLETLHDDPVAGFAADLTALTSAGWL